VTLRVFLDANVLFTAAYNPSGLARLLFELQQHKVLILLSSPQALEEARANLAVKKPSALAALQDLMEELELFDSSIQIPFKIHLPEDDLRIFSSAVAGRASHLLTGDKKDFGLYFDKPERTHGVRIQTVRQFFTERF
jgi:predicted nucleic acid-binding protein